MVEYSGKSYSCIGETVTGRLCRADTYGEINEDGAKILLWNGESEIADKLWLSAVGIVITEGMERDAQSISRFYHVPVLAVNGFFQDVRAESPIAILDAKRQKLYVDPDIETVSALLGEKRKIQSPEISRLLLCDYNNGLTVADGYDGIVIDDVSVNQDLYYEHLCDVADRNTGARLVALVEADGDDGTLTSRIRAVYRAGVWGRFSLLFRGIKTPDEREKCIYAFHSAFAQLDREGREFNGFMPKGMVIDTPVMLLYRERLKVFDFYCLDLETLTKSFCGADYLGGDMRHIFPYICEFIKSTEGTRICVISDGEQPTPTVERLLSMCGHLDMFVRGKIFEKSQKRY